MKKILIINLRRIGDIISTGHLINSIKSSSPLSMIDILTYKENSQAAECLEGIHSIHSIDRKRIITLAHHDFIPNVHAFDQIFQDIEPLTLEHWDMIINYSNELVGSYLASFLKSNTNKICGTYIAENRQVITQERAEILFNHIIPEKPISPMHFVDCYLNIAGASFSNYNCPLRITEENKATIEENISLIKSVHVDNFPEVKTENIKLIAIQLKTSSPEKDIPITEIKNFLNLLLSNCSLIPIIITPPNSKELELAKSINVEFKERIPIAESDLKALPAFLSSVDLVVTPDTSIKHFSDLVNTPVLEISIGKAPFLKQGTYAKNSLILSDLLSCKEESGNSSHCQTKILGSDIYLCMQLMLNPKALSSITFGESVVVYKPIFDEAGIYYKYIAGYFDSEIESRRTIERMFCNSFLKKKSMSPSFYISEIKYMSPSQKQSSKNFLQSEVDILTCALKDILAALRSLIQCSAGHNKQNQFVLNLENLLNKGDSHFLISIPLKHFRYRVENIELSTFSDNIKHVEIALFDLKADLQKILTLIKSFEDELCYEKEILLSP